MRPSHRTALLPALALVLTACGGGGGGSAPAPAALTVTPATALLATTPQSTAGNTKQFAASAAVTWTVQEASGGTITAAGLYTAPTTEGTYHVVATQQGDATRTATATVTVMAPPAITTQPGNQSAPVAGSVTFTVAAAGQQLAYQWKRNGAAIAGATSASYQLTNLAAGDSGATFLCTVSNPVGSVDSQQVLLSVQQPISITSFTATPAQVDFGGSATLAWSLSATPSVLTLDGVSALGSAGATVSPRNRQTYTLSASGGLNTDTKTVTVAARGIDLFAGSDGGRGNLDGKGAQARFIYPHSVVVDAAGNAYLANQTENRIRKIAPDGTVTTLAGAPQPGYADGTGEAARFSNAFSLSLAPSGSLVVADYLNSKIRQVTLAGVVTTLAASPEVQFPYSAAQGADGTLYVAQGNHAIRKIPQGGPAVVLAGSAGVSGSADGPGASARFNSPYGIAVDGSGNVYVADSGNHTIRKILPDGTVSTLAGSAGQNGYVNGAGGTARFSGPRFLAWDKSGTALLVGDSGNAAVRRVALDGTVSTVVKDSAFSAVISGFEAPDGRVFVADSNRYEVMVWNGTSVSTLAGKRSEGGSADGLGAAARFSSLVDVVLDGAGNAYVLQSNAVRKISPAGQVTTLSFGGTSLSSLTGLALAPDGTLVMVSFGLNKVYRMPANGGSVTVVAGSGAAGDADGVGAAATFQQLTGVSVAQDGTLYVVQYNGTLRKIAADGTVTTLAGVPGQAGIADGAGASARFMNPQGVFVASDGNILVGEWFGRAIRKATPAGVVTTWVGGTQSGFQDGQGSAARFDRPSRFAQDAAGNVYVSDVYNDAIRKVTPDGVVTTVVGAPGLRGIRPGALPATIYFPWGLAARPNGDLLVVSENGIMAVTAP